MSEVNEEQRVTLWRTGWGVAVAASGAFSIGYGASHFADPSIGAERTPLWPLIIAIVALLVSVWFLLAPTLHRSPFEHRPSAAAHDDILTGALSDDDEPAPIGGFRVEGPAFPEDHPTG